MSLTAPPSAPPAAPSAPGAAPARSDPASFRTRADAFVSWLVTFRDSVASFRDWMATYITWANTNVSELNALQLDVTGKQAAAAIASSSASANQVSAAGSASAALASLNAFQGQYYGALASDPTVDPLGNAPDPGDFYWNTTSGVVKVYGGGGAWSQFAAPPDGSVTTAKLAATIAPNVTSINGGPLAGLRNAIINGAFRVNQRNVSGTVTLAAGAYGHDRWKAGASGCTYTFAASGNHTVITITAGSLMQVIEGVNVETGAYVLAHQGTAQARMAVNGGTTSGSYFTASTASPQATTPTGGQNVTVEFSTGTVDRVQFEPGNTATTFERRHYGLELSLCLRYYQTAYATAVTAGQPQDYSFPAMRANPTISNVGTPGWTGGSWGPTSAASFRQTGFASASGSGTMALSAEL